MTIVYAIAVMQIGDLTESELKSASERIHPSLKEQYPHMLEAASNEISVNINENGNAETVVKTLPTVHRATSTRSKGISLAKNQLAYHTRDYIDQSTFIAEAIDVFSKVSEVLDVKYYGKISVRLVSNFAMSEDRLDDLNPFDGFTASRYLGPSYSCFATRGPSIFQATNNDRGTSTFGRTSIAVVVNGFHIPEELMEIGVKLLNVSPERIPALARIDLDVTWNQEATFYPIDMNQVEAKLQDLMTKTHTMYDAVQSQEVVDE